MLRNTLPKHTPTQSPLSPPSYLQQIESAMNKIRTKLPHISQYSPDKHFEYLCNPKNTISQQKLLQLIPLMQQYRQQQLQHYMNTAIHALNNNTHYFNYGESVNASQELGYAGYVRLVRTMPFGKSDVKGSQVNKTTIGRLTLEHQLLQDYRSKSGYLQYKEEGMYGKADSIVGLLMLLQCLKIKQQTIQLANKTQGTNLQHADNLNAGYGRGLKMMDNTKNTNNYGRGLKMLDNTKNTIDESHPQITVNKTLRKPIFSFTTRKPTPPQHNRPRPRIPFNKTKQTATTEYTPNHNTFYSPSIHKFNSSVYNPEDEYWGDGFLRGFSDEKNVWKNVHERNMEYRSDLKNAGIDNNSAFLEEQNQLQRILFFKDGQNSMYKSMLINKVNPNHYMFT